MTGRLVRPFGWLALGIAMLALQPGRLAMAYAEEEPAAVAAEEPAVVEAEVVETAEVAAEPMSPADELAAIKEIQASHKVLLDTLWVMLTAFLVFWMQAGFAYVEAGLTRAKSTNNIMMKNLMDFCLGTMAFWMVGFGIMFGDGNGFMGLSGWFLISPEDNSPATGDAYTGVFSALSWAGVPLYAKFMFQLVFAGTAATIVSGAMAERTKFVAYLAYSFLISLFIYPVVGHWIWGGGMACEPGVLGLRGIDGRALDRSLDGPGRRALHRSSNWQVHQG